MPAPISREYGSLAMNAVNVFTEPWSEQGEDAHMRPERLAWTGLRCCRMKMREHALRWRRRQAQLLRRPH